MSRFMFLLCLLRFSVVSSLDSGFNMKIDINSNGQNKSEVVYTQQFVAASMSNNTIIIRGLDEKFLSYAVVQLHSFYFSVTSAIDDQQQTGTNLGFVLKADGAAKRLYMSSNNNDEVQCMIAIVLYNHTAPSLKIRDFDPPTIELSQNERFIIAQTPGDETYFAYLPQFNFQHTKYFEGIESMIFNFKNSYKAKSVYSNHVKYFEKLPGTGMIINSIVHGDNGQIAFFVPSVTFSCPVNTWKSHCSEVDGLRRSLSIFLVLFAVVMIFNLLMPELIESILNGMLIGSLFTFVFTKDHHVVMFPFDIFISTLFGGTLFAAVFGIISLYFRMGRYLTKLTFSNFVIAIVMEVLFDSYVSIYFQFGAALALSIALHFIRISFSVFLGGFLLIVGLSNILKVGNIHRIFINNFHALTSIHEDSQAVEDSVWSILRYNFINYKIQLNLLDLSLIVFYLVGSILLTIRKEIYFRNNSDILDGHHFFAEYETIEDYNRSTARNRNYLMGISGSMVNRLKVVSRCPRHHYRSNVVHERSPLISHWLASDESENDEVFESPNTNSRFMRTLSSESKERIDQIQNFSN